MIKPLWVVAGIALLGITGAAGAVIVASPGGEEEALQQVATETASAAPSPTQPTPRAATATAPPTTTPAVPEDWATYSLPDAGLALRYPPAWYALKDGGIYSWDPATWDKPWYPPESVKIDILYGSSEFAEPRPIEATDISIATGSGWEITYSKDPATSDGLTRVHQIALKRGEFTLFIIAYFSQAGPDEGTFSQIVNSLRFAD